METIMKRKLLATSAAILLSAATAACSQPYGGMGPGMMGGYGPGGGQGYGQGQGPGYGPGQGYGPGPGPGYGYGYGYGYGMGPGMMGGYGGYGMGPGMMGGYGGYGMGPGMMGGYGGYGMGPGMMGGNGGYGYGPDLSAEQRAKIAGIQQEFAKKHWDLMGKMHEQGGPMAQYYGPGPIDEKAARKAYQEMADAQKQMFELSLDMRKKIDAVLTPEQREQMSRGWRGRPSR
jgi:Spy/CpxP family protein refolding chaperone